MITIKPHHFVDIMTALGDRGVDFSPHPYGHALHRVAQAILTDRDVMLCMEFGADDICLPCCHNIDGRCDDTIDVSFRPRAPASKEQYNRLLDERWSRRLGLRPGDQLSARELCTRIQKCAGDLTDVYCELPLDRTAERQVKLHNGVEKFLARDPDERCGHCGTL